MAWRSYNLLMNEPRVLVLDARCSSSFASAHIRGSFCVCLLDADVHVSRSSFSSSSPLRYVAGPPFWYPNCWWDRHVLLILPPSHQSRKRKRPLSSSPPPSPPPPAPGPHPVLAFLKEEGRVQSLRVLETDDSDDGETEDAFTIFAQAYPFLITKSTSPARIENHPTEVVPGLLYLGDLTHAIGLYFLENLHISHVVTVLTEPLRLRKPCEHTFYKLEDVSSADIGQYFDPTYEIIEKAKREGRRVLIHCRAGISRSATLCAAYLMRAKHWCAEDALTFLREQRSKVSPNPGFLAALEAYSAASAFNTCVSEFVEVPVLDQAKPLHIDIVKDGQCIDNVPVNENKIPFGCGEDGSAILNHESMSQHHGFLTCSTEQGEDSPASTCAQLMDNSIEDTFVNEIKISKDTPRAFRIGDGIELGANSCTYVYCDKFACSTDVGSLSEGIKKPKV